MRMAPDVKVQLPQRCDMSANAMDVHRSLPPKCRASDGRDLSTRRCRRRLITSAHLRRSACGIQSGTRSSRTPARSLAATVRRRRRVATIRMGGGNALGGLFKALCSDVAGTGVEGDSKRRLAGPVTQVVKRVYQDAPLALPPCLEAS